MICRRSFVSGRVQGVFYRATCVKKATELGLTGFARNLPDGRVEALAEGTPESVESFKHDLATGPAYAQVENIEEIHVEPTGAYSHFRIES